MEVKQVNSLKLNAKKINSVLIRGNSNVKKLRADENNLLLRIADEKKKKTEEKKVESRGKMSFPGKGMLGKVAKPVMSVFDKLLEFFGNILLGVLLEELPKAIAAAEKFFEDNPWIIPTVKNIFKFLGNTLMGMIDLVNIIKPAVITAFEKSRDAVISALNLFGIETDALMGEDMKSAEQSVDEAIAATQTEENETPAEEMQPTGEGPIPVQSNPDIPAASITPVSSSPEAPGPGPDAVESTASTPDSSSLAPAPQSPVSAPKPEGPTLDQFKFGGSIPKLGGGGSTPIRTRRQRRRMVQETGVQRKARERLSSYGRFFENMKLASSLDDKQSENNESFEKFLENYQKVHSLGKYSSFGRDPDHPEIDPRNPDDPVSNLENATFSDAAGAPSKFANTRDFQEQRSGYKHHGEDYPIAQGTAIRMLKGGIVHGGYYGFGDGTGAIGGQVLITHDDGTQTRYGHLSEIFVDPGQEVKPNDIIAKTGGDPGTRGAGRSSGPHLHLEYYPSTTARYADPYPVADKYFVFGKGESSNNGDGEGGPMRPLSRDRSGNISQSMDDGMEVVYIIQPMVQSGRDTILIRNIDRPTVMRSKSNLKRPSLA